MKSRKCKRCGLGLEGKTIKEHQAEKEMYHNGYNICDYFYHKKSMNNALNKVNKLF